MASYRTLAALIALCWLGCPQWGSAGPRWMTNSLTLLDGERYKLTPSESATVMTFEHASVYEQADLFLFIDRFRYDTGKYSTYSEFSPRWMVTRFQPGESGVVKQLGLAGTWERGRGPGAVNFDHYLAGVGVDLSLPGFRYTKFNLYYRNNEDKPDNWQLTTNFALPFTLGSAHFLYDGFIDWTSATDRAASSTNATTQLKWDISRFWGAKGKLYLGMEYVFWHNKYGVKDVNEHNPNLLLKWHFP